MAAWSRLGGVLSLQGGIGVYRFFSLAMLGAVHLPQIPPPVPTTAEPADPRPAHEEDPGQTLILVHADGHIVVADKPAGLLSVPGRGPQNADCLATRVQAMMADAQVVHRLDQATSGLMVLARGAAEQRRLSIAFAQRQVHKRYIAVVGGLLAGNSGEISLPLIADWPLRPRQKVDHDTGKPSLTQWQVLARDAATQRTRLLLTPVTGRSHQLRVHLAAIGHAIVGDTLYADEALAAAAPRLLLHAYELGLPTQDGGWLSFESAVPF